MIFQQIARVVLPPRSPPPGRSALDYAFADNTAFTTWSWLAILLTSAVAKAVYVIPVAGYIILYSNYFSRHFDFAVTGEGFLSFTQRIYMVYYGSLVLLAGYVLYFIAVPRFLRFKTSLYQFVNEIVAADDFTTIDIVGRSCLLYLQRINDHDLPEIDAQKLRKFADQLRNTYNQMHDVRDVSVTTMLRFYFNWKNDSRPSLRRTVFMLSVISYTLLLLPAFDLFIRVLSSTLKP